MMIFRREIRENEEEDKRLDTLMLVSEGLIGRGRAGDQGCGPVFRCEITLERKGGRERGRKWN